jgi:flavin-dependent dehydrogenase
MPPPDVTIIGAGPAGSLAACVLAQRGWDISLIEQHRFPRDKVCGESLSALGIDVLTRAGLAERIRALDPVPITRTTLHAPDGRRLDLPLPRAMWGVSRSAMDHALLESARAAGARILQPARCESINGHLTIRHLPDNRSETLTPTYTLLADGKAALLPARPRPTTDFGVKAHFINADAPRDAVQLFGVTGHYVGVAPVESNRTNVAFSVPAHRLESFRGALGALWQQLLRENTALAKQFAHATRTTDWLASPLPRFAVVRDWPQNVIPLGNSAAALEPIGGEGIGLALRSAELTADALESARRTHTPLPAHRLATAFDSLWRRRRFSCRALARLLSAPTLAGPALEWGSANSPLSRAVLWAVGKS